MSHIDTTDPRPRKRPLSYPAIQLGSDPPTYLDVPDGTHNPLFWDVVTQRRSRRTFRALRNEKLCSLLWYSLKTTSRSQSDGRSWEHRPVPSAGGLHPILVLIQPPERNGFPLLLYDPIGHAVRKVDALSAACLALRAQASTVVDVQDGTMFWLIADFNKIDAHYENASSLAWKDTGILLGSLCLVAEALELNACPLGVCGHSWLSAAIALPDGVYGVGAIVVGERTSQLTQSVAPKS